MGFIIVSRNPRSGKLVAITEGENEYSEHVSEYKTEEEANDAANGVTACVAWGFQVLEVD